MFHCLQRTIANRYDLLAIAMPRRSVIFGNAVASRLDVAGNVLATQVIHWSLARQSPSTEHLCQDGHNH